MAINTLITLRDKLREFADGHAQIQRIYFGADDKRAPVLTDAELFPAVYVAPIDKVSGRAHDTHRLRIYIYERLDSAASDEWENANDTSLIFRDFRVWWNDYGTDDILIESDPTGTFKTDSELDNLVGYFGEFLFQIPSHGRCQVPVNIEPSPNPTCEPVTYNVEYANGDPIESGTEPSGGHIEVIVPNPACEPVTLEVNGIEIGSEPSGGAFELSVEQGGIEVGSLVDGVWVVPECEPCEDATAVLIDTATPTPNTISTTPISSGSSANIVAPDGTVTVNRDGVFFATQTVRSNGTATVNVPSNNSMPNTGIYKSGQTILVLPSDAVRNLEGMGADWWNLDPATQNANIFGNYKRFTSSLGNYQSETNGLFYDKNGNVLPNYAAAFPMGMIVDWSTRDWQYGKVLAYALNNVVAGLGDTRANLDTQFEALTIGSYSNWKLPNLKELFNICRIGSGNRTNYIPFNNSANLATNFWVRDAHDALTGSRINLGSGSNFIQTGLALNSQNRGLAVSYLTISGNTLI